LTLQLLGLGLLTGLLLLPEVVGLAAAIASGHTTQSIPLWIVIAIALLLLLGRYFLLRLDYDMRYYLVTDRCLRIRHGALVIQESTFTFANVQNVTVHQGPIDRLLGIANLRIDTAGGGHATDKQNPFISHRGLLAGIDNAESVRDQILGLLKAYRDAGLGDHEDKSHPLGSSQALSAAAIERLREIRDEIRALRTASRI